MSDKSIETLERLANYKNEANYPHNYVKNLLEHVKPIQNGNETNIEAPKGEPRKNNR